MHKKWVTRTVITTRALCCSVCQGKCFGWVDQNRLAERAEVMLGKVNVALTMVGVVWTHFLCPDPDRESQGVQHPTAPYLYGPQKGI